MESSKFYEEDLKRRLQDAQVQQRMAQQHEMQKRQIDEIERRQHEQYVRNWVAELTRQLIVAKLEQSFQGYKWNEEAITLVVKECERAALVAADVLGMIDLSEMDKQREMEGGDDGDTER